MTVTTVDHVEFYVGDAKQTGQFLCTAFGFQCIGQGGPETGLPGQRSLLLGHGDARLLVTSALAPDHPVARYVDRHGDGVACVAMTSGDAAGDYGAAVRAAALPVAEPRTWRRGDATVVTAAVSGPGAITHRLVERHGDIFLPGGIEPVVAAEASDGLLGLIDHIALCVPAGDLAPTARFYRQVFGFKEIFEERIEVGDQAMDSKVVQSGMGGTTGGGSASRAVTFTIVAPDAATRSGQLDDFLRANAGAGVQHLALSTHDIATAVRTFSERGVRFLSTPDSYYDGIQHRLGDVGLPIDSLRAGNILVDRDHWGEMFQIFTTSPFDRRTFFFELIERHGALTFGTNNIRALYEAKDRARTDHQ